MLLGLTNLGDFLISAARRCVAIYGAPQGGTSGHVPTMVATWPGLVVWVTARGGDAVRTSGILRARMAGGVCDLIDLPMDGSPTPPGLKRRGWTPVTTDWEEAQRTMKAIVSGALGGEGRFWSQSAALVGAAFLLAAGLDGLPMRWVRRSIKMHNADEAIEILQRAAMQGAPGAAEAEEELQALLAMSDRTAADVWATMGTALAAYASRAVLDVTDIEAVDLVAAINSRTNAPNAYLARPGQPAPLGCHPTIYVRANPSDQERLVPQICGVLARLWFARQTTPGAPPVLLVLDDMASIAIWNELPAILSLASGAGLIVLGIFHDEAQLTYRWGKGGDSMVTHFAEKLIFRGIEDEGTRKRLSTSSGLHMVELTTRSESVSQGSRIAGILTGPPPAQRGSEAAGIRCRAWTRQRSRAVIQTTNRSCCTSDLTAGSGSGRRPIGRRYLRAPLRTR